MKNVIMKKRMMKLFIATVLGSIQMTFSQIVPNGDFSAPEDGKTGAWTFEQGQWGVVNGELKDLIGTDEVRSSAECTVKGLKPSTFYQFTYDVKDNGTMEGKSRIKIEGGEWIECGEFSIVKKNVIHRITKGSHSFIFKTGLNSDEIMLHIAENNNTTMYSYDNLAITYLGSNYYKKELVGNKKAKKQTATSNTSFPVWSE